MAIARLDAAVSVAANTLAYTVSAGFNRMLVVCTSYEAQAQRTTTGIDYGGQAMVQSVQQDTPDAGPTFGCSIWYILEAGIAAAVGNVITPTISGTFDDQMIHAISYVRANQTGGATTNPATASAETNEATPNPVVADLTEATGGAVVAITGSGNNTTHTWSAAMTEQTDQAGGTTASSMADRLSSTSANVDIEGTSASQNRAAICSASFAFGGIIPQSMHHYRNHGKLF